MQQQQLVKIGSPPGRGSHLPLPTLACTCAAASAEPPSHSRRYTQDCWQAVTDMHQPQTPCPVTLSHATAAWSSHTLLRWWVLCLPVADDAHDDDSADVRPLGTQLTQAPRLVGGPGRLGPPSGPLSSIMWGDVASLCCADLPLPSRFAVHLMPNIPPRCKAGGTVTRYSCSGCSLCPAQPLPSRAPAPLCLRPRWLLLSAPWALCLAEEQFVEVLMQRKEAALAAELAAVSPLFKCDLVIDIELRDVTPRVWRRFKVSGGMTLATLQDKVGQKWERSLRGMPVGDVCQAMA